MRHLEPNFKICVAISRESIEDRSISLKDFEYKLAGFLTQFSVLTGCDILSEYDHYTYAFRVCVSCNELLALGIEHRLTQIANTPHEDRLYDVDNISDLVSSAYEINITQPLISSNTDTRGVDGRTENTTEARNKCRKIFIDIK